MFSLTTMVLYERSIEGAASLDISSAGGFVCRELAARDRSTFERLLAVQRMRETIFQPTFGIEDVDERLRRGERCFVCEDGERIAGYIWFSTLGKYIAEIDATLQLEDGDVYAYNAYVDQGYRGRNITPSILVAASRAFLGKGFGRLLLFTMNWNENTHRTLRKADFLRGGNLRAGYFATFRFFVNSCRNVNVSWNAGHFEFYGKLFRKAAAALSRGTAARGRMV
jgi:ribosomal protein S18 acetylase RimI-like enzyme